MKYLNILLFISLIMGVTIFTEFQNSNNQTLFDFFNSDSKPNPQKYSNLLFGISVGLVMVLGIIFGHLYTSLGATKKKTINIKDLKKTFTEKQLWRSIIASPIIFGVIYSFAKEAEPVMSLLFSFENGFFCNAILTNRKKIVEEDENYA